MTKDIIQVTTTVNEIVEVKQYPQQKYKLAFRCKSTNSSCGRLCIRWGFGIPPRISVSDTVNLEGKIKNDVFLVYSMKFKPQG